MLERVTSSRTSRLLVAAILALGAMPAQAGPGGGTYYANSPHLRKFVDTLPGLGPTNANNLGQYIPVANPDTVTFPGSDYYVIAVRDFTERMHTDLPKATKIRGYVQLNNGTRPGGTTLADNTVLPAPPHQLGPVIVAQRNRPVRVKFVNHLGTGAAGASFLPVDPSMMGAGLGPNSWTWNGSAFVSNPAVTTYYAENRAELHLHGGFTPWISDGTPHQWITPAGDPTPYKKGMAAVNVPDMPDPGGAIQGEQTYYYTNAQSARLMFYHDHALGMTRLNVYAGEAAGFLVRDSIEAAMEANGTLPAFAYNLPLIIQDKTFVPTDVAIQDALWDTVKWGAPGDLWFPHIYETNQDPSKPGGMSPTGRWDYGPWFWPPATVTNPPLFGGLVANLPSPSVVPEAFMDTMVVNGTAYPTTTVQPRRYRLRILNASNDRTLNLQMYKADPSYAAGTPGAGTEVKMIPPPQPIPRIGGIPDPALAGPPWILIGTEGGFLPQPVVLNDPALHQLWIGYDLDPRSITINNVKDVNLMLGPAQRADVIVDFSTLAPGTKLILYNDSPAPVPAGDARLDYYTGNPDMTATGGAPSTPPGVGPNTRTIMQFVVGPLVGAADPDTHATTLAKLSDPIAATGLPKAFATGQDPLLLPPSAGAYQLNNVTPYAWDLLGNSIPIYRKAIQELFDPEYGRMNSLLGSENQWVNGQNQNTNFAYYLDIPTEFLQDGQTTAWKVVHNGVDTHFIHFHLFNVQVVGRVDWAGVVKAPYADEGGWRETVRMDPLESTIVAMKPAKPPVPFAVPTSVRPVNVTMPSTGTVGSTWSATANPNPTYDFGWEYVWHCHLLGHEENDMMRPMVFQLATALPVSLAPLNPTGALALPRAAALAIDVTWNVYQASAVAPITSFVIADEIAYRVERRPVGGAWLKLADVQYIHNRPSTFFPSGFSPWPTPIYTDPTPAPGVPYDYRVIPFNKMGDGPALATTASPMLSVIPPATGVTITATTTSPSAFGVPVGFSATGTGSTAYQYRFWLSSDAGVTYTMVQDYGVGSTWVLPATTLGGSYTLKVDVRSSTTVPLDASATRVQVVGAIPATGVTLTPSLPSPQVLATPVTFTAQGTGSVGYQYRFWLSANNGTTWTVVQDWSATATYALPTTTPIGVYVVLADVRTSLTVPIRDAYTFVLYEIASTARPPATGVTLTSSVGSPVVVGAPVTFTAAGQGSSGYQYRFWLSNNNGATWTTVQDWSATATYTMPTAVAGSYVVIADVRTSATNPFRDAYTVQIFDVVATLNPPATGITLSAAPVSPQRITTPVTFTAAGTGSTGYQYRFWFSSDNGTTWTTVRDWSSVATWSLPTTTAAGTYVVLADVRTNGGSTLRDTYTWVFFTLTP